MQKKRTNYNLKPLVALLLLCVAMVATLQAQNAYFSVVGGIPHLPVYAATSSVASPVPGAMIYSTADAAPMFYSGATDGWQKWCTAKPALTTGAYTNFTVTAAGLPCLPVSAVATGAAVSGAVYYPSGGTGLLVNNAAAWYTPKNLTTNTAPTATSNVTAGNITGYTSGGFALPVLASDPSFVATDKGAVYLNTDKTLHVNNGTAWVSVTCRNCPASITVNHVASTTVPATATITYNVVDVPNADGVTGSCWCTRNLGATSMPSAFTDYSAASNGWWYQFGYAAGFTFTWAGVTNPTAISSTSWVANASVSNAYMTWIWQSDPCYSQLGDSWYVASNNQWTRMCTYESILSNTIAGSTMWNAMGLSVSGGVSNQYGAWSWWPTDDTINQAGA